MTDARSGLGRVVKLGCFGCLAVAVMAAVAAAVLTGIAWRQAETEDIEERDLSRAVGVEPAEEGLGSEDVPLELGAEEPAGRVVLDLRHTTFEIGPGAAGEPVRVRATYDTNTYELSERFQVDEATGSWTYEVGFRRTSASFLVAVIKQLFSGSRPRVAVSLPPDVPYDLELHSAQGGGEVELGGLWLTSAEIDFQQGGGWVGFSEPLLEPVESLALRFTQGGGEIEGVGNASPRELNVSFAMGGGDVDLRGAWQRDADVTIGLKMGGASVWLPDNAEVRGIDRSGLRAPRAGEVPQPVLTVSTSSRFGEVEYLD